MVLRGCAGCVVVASASNGSRYPADGGSLAWCRGGQTCTNSSHAVLPMGGDGFDPFCLGLEGLLRMVLIFTGKFPFTQAGYEAQR